MRPPLHRISRAEGTIMIFALVIILAGTLVLAGWVQMMATATVFPDTGAEGVRRRISMENARAMARQYMLSSLPGGATITNAAWEASISNGTWGGCSVNAAAGFWTSTNQLDGNPFCPFGEVCFVVTNLASLSNGYQTNQQRFYVKSRSPLFAGYPLVIQQNASTNTTNMAWAPSNRVVFTDIVGFNQMPEIPFTSGTNSSGNATNGYLGYLNAPMATNYSYSTVTTGITYTNATNTGASVTSTNRSGSTYTTNYNGGQISVVLATTQNEAILRYQLPDVITNQVSFTNTSGTNTIIRRYSNAAPTNLTLTGATNTNSLHIIIPSSSTNANFTNIFLSGTNNSRNIYLNDQTSGNLTIRTATTSATYSWRMGITMSGGNLTIAAPTSSGTSLRLTNGIRSDQSMTLSNGTLTLSPTTIQDNVGELMADRIIWLEDGRNR